MPRQELSWIVYVALVTRGYSFSNFLCVTPNEEEAMMVCTEHAGGEFIRWHDMADVTYRGHSTPIGTVLSVRTGDAYRSGDSTRMGEYVILRYLMRFDIAHMPRELYEEAGEPYPGDPPPPENSTGMEPGEVKRE